MTNDLISREKVCNYIAEFINHEYSAQSECEMVNLMIDGIRHMESFDKPQLTNALDKIRAEMHANAEYHDDGDCYLRDEWIDEIFDKYKAERSE